MDKTNTKKNYKTVNISNIYEYVSKLKKNVYLYIWLITVSRVASSLIDFQVDFIQILSVQKQLKVRINFERV